MYPRHLLLFLLLLGITTKQSYAQVELSGIVRASETLEVLGGATVTLLPLNQSTITDKRGNFTFTELPPGRYQLRITYVGYQPYLLAELELEAGRSPFLEILLYPSTEILGEVVVKSTNSNSAMRPLATHSLTLEETFRLPATFFDPARLAANYPGVIVANDQANALSIRGQTPNQVIWRVENLDLVNPNHTANAGTFSDRVTQSAGGVIILSAQTLDNSTIFKGNLPVGLNNTIGGLMDMELRKGAADESRQTLQVGLIGLEAALEGPIGKNQKTTYLTNYRYSTVGLLSNLGFDLGEEAISFQDLSFQLNFDLPKNGQLTFFGLGGLSENIFEAEPDSSLWKLEEDVYNRNFQSRMGATGISLVQPNGKKAILKGGAAFSGLKHERMVNSTEPAISVHRTANDTRLQSILSTYLQQQWALNNNLLKLGVRFNYQTDSIDFSENNRSINRNTSESIITSYAEFQAGIAPKWRANLGLNAVYYAGADRYLLEPRIDISHLINNKQHLLFSYALQSQSYIQYSGEPGKAHHLNLSYQWRINRSLQLRSEFYYQYLFNIPINIGFNFSALNQVDQIADFELSNTGAGRNYGVELLLQQYFTKNQYLIVSSAIFESEYQLDGDDWYNTRFNSQYQLNLVYGKEWEKINEKQKNKRWGINLRLNLRGGFWENNIDESASRDARQTVFLRENDKLIQLPGFFRADLRIFYKINNPKGLNSTLSLDIQNVSNNENAAFRYFDPLTMQIETKNQLSLIPILNYRIEF